MTRHILRLSGPDRIDFLQNLVTNDVTKAAPDRLIYAALLTPQGKYLADFIIHATQDALLLDVAQSHAPLLAQRLTMYKLRAKVDLDDAPLSVSYDDQGLPDPRHPSLPHRLYGTKSHAPDPTELRVAHVIPETGIELTADSYILEAGFERLNGVDFRKGCYVGQEVTARMKHKTTLNKGLMRLQISGAAPVGTPIMAENRQAGTLYSQTKTHAITHMRFDRVASQMTAETALLAPCSETKDPA